MNIEIRNFQSIEHITLRIDGYTALVGRSNIGKSAIVRAVNAALTGASGTNFVRHASTCPRRVKKAKTCRCQASVHLTDEGFDLLWEKGDAVNRYTYNGQVYDRADRGPPPFLSPKFDPVKVGGTAALVQVAPQQQPIYLLDQTGGVVADVLSDVAKLDRINVAVRLVERDKKEVVATRKVRQADIAKGEATLSRFDGLPTALSSLRKLEGQVEAIGQQERQVERVERWATVVGQTEAAVARLSPVEQVPTFDASRVRAAAARHQQVSRFEQNLQHLLPEVKRLGSLELTPLDPAAIKAAWARYTKVDGFVTALQTFKAEFQRLEQVQKVGVPSAETLREKGAAYQRVVALFERHEQVLADIARLEAELARVTAEAEKVQAEWDALGVCPTCVRPFHPDSSCPASPLSIAPTSTCPTRARPPGRGTTRRRCGTTCGRSGSWPGSMKPGRCSTAGTTST